jgi:hypothetical protein
LSEKLVQSLIARGGTEGEFPQQRLAGYEDLDDAARLSTDPTFR